LAAGLAWLGIGMIITACFLFNNETAFPGHAALLPTVGAALIILAGPTIQPWASYRILKSAPFQFLGNASYSLYLWHWPVLILYRANAWNLEITLLRGLEIMAFVIFCAYVSRRWVEDPFRQGNWRQQSRARSPGMIWASSFCLIVIASATIMLFAHEELVTSEEVTAALLSRTYDPSKRTIPSVRKARLDGTGTYGTQCHADQYSSEAIPCIFGPTSAPNTLVLVGDSHADQWLPALQSVYKKRPNWRVLTFIKSGCPFNAAPVFFGWGKEQQRYTSCSEWNLNVLSELNKIRPNVIIVSALATYNVVGIADAKARLPALTEGLLVRWKQLSNMDINIIAIRDTPKMARNIPECLSTPNTSIEACSTPISQALPPDPIVEAMKTNPQVTFLDLTPEICDAVACRPIRGQVLAYRDKDHLTATFSRLLADKIEPLLP
jgi:hypothetical protein